MSVDPFLQHVGERRRPECASEYADLDYQQIEQYIKEEPTVDGEIVEPNSLCVESAHK